MRRFALLAGALLAAAIPASAQTGAAPARADYVPNDIWRDEHHAAFYERWFGDELHDMGEPVLSHPGDLGPYRRRFRMLVLSHYRPGFAMRIDASSMGGVMHLVSMDGRSAHAPNPTARRRRLPLSGDDVRALNNMIDRSGLARMAAQSPPYQEPVPDPVTMGWRPDSWRAFEALQQPDYPDPAALDAATRELGAYPPLVRPREIDALRGALAEAQAGRAFLLQGGDCAESFAEFSPANIAGNLRADRGDGGAARPRVGPAGGPDRADGRPVRQAALALPSKARRRRCPPIAATSSTASPSSAGARRPDPERMFRAYAQAAATLAISSAGAAAARLPYQPRGSAPPLRAGAGPPRRAVLAMRARPISCGSASAPPSRARPMSSSSAASPTRSGSNAGRTLAPDALLRLLDRDRPGQQSPAGSR